MPILKDILEVDNFVGIHAHWEHCNFVQNFHGAVYTVSDPRWKFGCVCYACFSMDTFPYSSKQSTEKEKTLNFGLGHPVHMIFCIQTSNGKTLP